MKQNKYLKNSLLNTHLLELVRLRIGQINECNYCMKLHYEELKYMGESNLRLSLLNVWSKVPYFSMKERAVLALTDKIITKNEIKSCSKVYNLLLAYFSNDEINSLKLAIKQIDNWTQLMNNQSKWQQNFIYK